MSTTIIFLLVMVALLAASIGLQMWRTRRSPLGRVLQIFANVRYAEKLCRDFSYSRGAGRFKVSGWENNKHKVPFVPEELRDELSRLFNMLADANVKIDTAMKFKSDAYLVTVDVKKLEEPLTSAKRKLQEWLQANMHNSDYLPKRISFFRW